MIYPHTKTYRGWNIDFEYGRYVAVHKDFEASYEGPEDGWVGSHPTLSAATEDHLKALIDDYIQEGCEACDGEGVLWNNADPTSGQSVACPECQEWEA